MAKAGKTEKKTGMSAAFKKKLKAAKGSWTAAKERAAEASMGSEFDDGKYMARLVSAKLGESQGGRLQIDFGFKLQDGEQEGQTKHDYQGLESEQNLEFAARRLAQLGYDLPDDLEDIESILDDIEATKPLCKIRIKTKGDYQNVYIDKVFGEDEEVDDEDSDDDEDESNDESDTEDEAESEDEEEEKPEPKKKAAKKAAKAAPPADDEDESEDESEDEDESEEEDDEDEQVQLTKGMAVIVTTAKGGDRPAKVVEVLEDEGKVRVKFTDGKEPEALRVAFDKLSAPDDAEDEEEDEDEVPEEPKPKKKAAKK